MFRCGIDPVPLVVVAVHFAVLGWFWVAGRLTPGVLLAVVAGGVALSFLAGTAEELWARWCHRPRRARECRGG